MKKLLILFLSLILLVSAIPTVSVSAAKEPTFVVSKEKADAGDTVKVTISTKNNPGIISMKLLVKYDANALELTDAKDGKFNNVVFSDTKTTPFIVNWIDSIHPNNKTNGTVATLVFKVLDTAPEGKSEISVSYDPDDVFEMTSSNDFVNVTFATQNGYVDITNSNATSNSSSKQETDEDTVSSDDNQTSSNVPDSTYSQILEQIYESADNQSVSDEVANNSGDGSVANQDESQNSWIIWVVIAAVVLLGGAFAVVIMKSKKDK